MIAPVGCGYISVRPSRDVAIILIHKAASSSLVAAGNSLGYESRAHPDANIINLTHYFL